MTVRRPWRSAEQATLLDDLRAGRPPALICTDLARTPDDVHRRITSLLDEGPTAAHAGDVADLDLLWLRLRGAHVAPTPPTPAAVAAMWQSMSGVALSPAHQDELARDPAIPALTAAGRHALLVSGRQVLDATGLLDLDEWRRAATDLAAPADPGPARPGAAWTAAARRLLTAVVDDIAPDAPRRALRAHLSLDGPGGHPTRVDHPLRRAAVVEVSRAAGVAGRPAAILRDVLVEPRAVELLVTSLGPSFAAATTLAMFGGRHETEALRVAGRVTSPWRRPPDLGRGAVVRTRVG